MTNTDELMETSLTKANNIKTQTYVFDDKKGVNYEFPTLRTKVWRIIPSSCSYLIGFCFGLMTAWCSSTFPKLLAKDSEITINMDQSALIAGFLMIGNMFGTLPSHFVPFGAKNGIISALLLMFIGWFVLWQANNIYCILASRFLIGFGNSFGTHHGKEYIKDTSESNMRDILVKSVQIYIGIGVLVGYCFGPHVSFRTFSVISLVITTVIFLFFLFLPRSPTELIKLDKIVQAKTVLQYIKPNLDIETEVKRIKSIIRDQSIDFGLDIFRNSLYSRNFAVLMFLVFFQQFSGAAPTIVYCILILKKLTYPNPEMFAIVYILFFIFGNAVGTFYLYKYNIKYCLLLSSFLTSVVLILNTVILYFNTNEEWVYAPYVLLILFIFFHSIGLGSLPFLLTPKLFARVSFVSQVQIIFYSIWAIVVTKVFQVLFTRYSFYVPFLMFSIAGVLGTLFILIFMPSDLSGLVENKARKTSTNNNV